MWMIAILASLGAETKPITINPGERIVMVGDGLIEREGAYGYIETELLCAFPKTPMKIRNLGWSGDTPAGISRAYFDPPEKGFERLIEQIKACEPTMVIVGYGMADALEGTPAAEFGKSLERLLDHLPKTVRKIVLLSPIPRSMGCGLVGPPSGVSADPLDLLLEKYPAEMQRVASQRHLRFIDLYSFLSRVLPTTASPMYGRSFQLNDRGYRVVAREILRIPEYGDITTGNVDAVNKSHLKKHFERTLEPEPMELRDGAVRWNDERFESRTIKEGLEFTMEPKRLPALFDGSPHVTWKGLEAGQWRIVINGIDHGDPTAERPHGEVDPLLKLWLDQREELRQLVRKKNSLYFQRYRPQNITYLLGFRKYEQGQNAKEIEALDPKIAELEKQIDELRVPRTVKVVLKRLRK